MELNKENQHIVMQWNDSYFIAADNGILSMLSQKNCSSKNGCY
jgi:S-adenosylmethionine hydrolase